MQYFIAHMSNIVNEQNLGMQGGLKLNTSNFYILYYKHLILKELLCYIEKFPITLFGFEFILDKRPHSSFSRQDELLPLCDNHAPHFLRCSAMAWHKRGWIISWVKKVRVDLQGPSEPQIVFTCFGLLLLFYNHLDTYLASE